MNSSMHTIETSASAAPPADLVMHMGDYVTPFVSAVFIVKPDDDPELPGHHIGTGGFMCLGDLRHLLTCEHVTRKRILGTLATHPFGADGAFSLRNDPLEQPFPVDAAAVPVPERTWSLQQHRAQCVTVDMLASSHHPVEGEYLYVFGFPGDEARAAFGTHHYRGVEVLTHECAYDPVIQSEPDPPLPVGGYHIFLPCNPESARQMSGPKGDLSGGGGMSGSFLWNTRYKEVTSRGLVWRPEDSRITGIVWGYSKKAGVLVATPIDHLQRLLSRLR